MCDISVRGSLRQHSPVLCHYLVSRSLVYQSCVRHWCLLLKRPLNFSMLNHVVCLIMSKLRSKHDLQIIRTTILGYIFVVLYEDGE